MADIQRTVGVKLVTTTEGDAEVFSQTAAELGELGAAATETADVLPDITSALEDVEPAVRKTKDASTLLKGDFRDLSQAAQVVGVDMEKLNKVLVSTSLAMSALKITGEITGKLNELSQALGGSGEAFQQWGPAIFPKESFDSLIQALTDTRGYIEEHNGALDASIEKHEQVRAKYLEARDAIAEKNGALREGTEAHQEEAEAAKKSAEDQVAAAQKAAEAWQKHLDELRDSSARRTEEELAKNAEILAEQQAKAAAVVEEIKARFEETFANDPNVAFLDAINKKLEETKSLADETAASLDRVSEAAGSGPLSAPEGGHDRILRTGEPVRVPA